MVFFLVKIYNTWLELSSHLMSTGEEGQWGRTSGRGWHISFKKSLQQNTVSLFWLKLVPYRTGARISEDIYLALSSNGSSKNFVPTSIILLTTSLGMPWFTSCINPQLTINIHSQLSESRLHVLITINW